MHIEECREDTSSTSSKDLDNEDFQSETGQEIATNECIENFGNIVVNNSSDVQIGNKNYYQGPVTIKQIVYKVTDSDKKLSIENRTNENFRYIPEEVIHADDVYITTSENEITNKDVNYPKELANKGAHYWENLCAKHKLIISICLRSVSAVLLIVVIAVLIHMNSYIASPEQHSTEPIASFKYYTTRSTDIPNFNVPISTPAVDNFITPKLHFVPRIEWVAQPPVNPANNLKLPVPYIIILSTETENCTDHGKCIKIVRQVQNFHIESNGWWDIAYNFLVGGNGYVYEGRGWKKEGANALGWNNRSIGIAFIGTFSNVVLPRRQMIACEQLIQEGINKGYLTKDYKLVAYSQVSDTQSPGNAFYNAIFDSIKTSHWSKEP